MSYEVGDLHLLANAIEDFQDFNRVLFKEELDNLHAQLVRLIAHFDRRIDSPCFPLQPRRKGKEATS